MGVVAAVALAAACSQGESAEPDTPRPRPTGRVASIPDAATLILDTGVEVRLAGVYPPLREQGAVAAEPLFDDARALTHAFAMGVQPRYDPPLEAAPRDRWGRVLTQVYAPGYYEEIWLQARLVDAGMARVEPGEGMTRAEAVDLLARESEARDAATGLWDETYYAVRDPETVAAAIGSFQIVEGVVVDTAEVNDWIYVNFGADYRTDFTASASPEDRAAFDAEALIALSGARVRVRGFIEEYNGPLIRLREREQIERLN